MVVVVVLGAEGRYDVEVSQKKFSKPSGNFWNEKPGIARLPDCLPGYYLYFFQRRGQVLSNTRST